MQASSTAADEKHMSSEQLLAAKCHMLHASFSWRRNKILVKTLKQGEVLLAKRGIGSSSVRGVFIAGFI